LPHDLLAQTAASVLLEQVDVREVDDRHAVRRGTAEADLTLTVVETDDSGRLVDQAILGLPRPPCRPVALVAQVAMHLGAVDPALVVVELEPVGEGALHAMIRSRAITPSTTR